MSTISLENRLNHSRTSWDTQKSRIVFGFPGGMKLQPGWNANARSGRWLCAADPAEVSVVMHTFKLDGNRTELCLSFLLRLKRMSEIWEQIVLQINRKGNKKVKKIYLKGGSRGPRNSLIYQRQCIWGHLCIRLLKWKINSGSHDRDPRIPSWRQLCWINQRCIREL